MTSDRRIAHGLVQYGARSARYCVLMLMAVQVVSAAERISHRVHIEGHGHATVVFENGLGDTLDVWREVQSKVATNCARTVSYNRAGYPGSTPSERRRDARSVVEELRLELQRQGLRPPYVLVGHSLGGLYTQYFARQFPDEVAGLVLVDSTHWNQQLLAGAPFQNHYMDPYTNRGTVRLFMSFIARREVADSALAGNEVHMSPPARSVPTVVLSRTGALQGETPAARAESARLQDEIAADFPGARHLRVDRSGHYIQKDRPDVVIDSVRELAKCGRSGR